jgi:dipeptidase D
MIPSDYNLQPALLWRYFLELSAIPRASGKTQAIQQWLIAFAQKKKLSYQTDATGNVLICKPASKGKEAVAPVVLQSHMDMVCEKNADVTHNFETDPIEPVIDGDWIRANGTTLGADNGIGVAAQLAVLADERLSHGPIECLFTVDEETGLTGAINLQPHFFEGNRLFNLDSEEHGEFYIGCAGGMNTSITFNFKTEPTPAGHYCFKLSIKGLLGGHSGDEIHKGRGNANHLLARLLWTLNSKHGVRLHFFTGGNLSNAIPREATCLAAVPEHDKEAVRILVNFYQHDLEEEFGSIEPSLKIELSSEASPAQLLIKADSDRFIDALFACPNGVIAMSRSIPGLVETSLNLASVKLTGDNQWTITTSQRSSLESAKHALSNRVQALFELAGMTVSHGDGYPGWNPNPDSALVKQAVEVYTALEGASPVVMAIHAGLECGLFLDKYPGLDMVSFGPTMRGVHSPDERMNIPSVTRFWALLVALLEKLN